jgi:polyhydroxybutyrate depolymerase
VPALIALASVLGLALVVVAVLLVRERNAGTEVVEPARASSTSTTEATSTTVPVRRPSGSEVPGRIDGGKVEGGVRIQTGYIADGVLQRPYLVYSPADADPVERLPMVMVLHGRGVTSQQMAREVDWKSAVATDRFVAVFPQGVLDSWNAGPCCPPASALGTNDVGFLDRVVAAVSERPDVDSARRYLTGFSNGGIMTYEMACERSEEFAAYAPMSGSNLSGCSPPRPVSLFHQHGVPDFVVPFNGEPSPSQVLSSAPFPAVPATLDAWARDDNCPTPPRIVDEGRGVTRTTWSNCGLGTKVELLTYPGNGHAWPKGPVDGLDELLRFFGIRA